MSIKDVKTAISAQWQAMIQAGCIPVMEWKMSNGDWISVDINYDTDLSYLTFSFDQNEQTWFDGIITGEGGHYCYPLDECFDSLDHYLQEIADNIIEGYLLPNGLYAED